MARASACVGTGDVPPYPPRAGAPAGAQIVAGARAPTLEASGSGRPAAAASAGSSGGQGLVVWHDVSRSGGAGAAGAVALAGAAANGGAAIGDAANGGDAVGAAGTSPSENAVGAAGAGTSGDAVGAAGTSPSENAVGAAGAGASGDAVGAAGAGASDDAAGDSHDDSDDDHDLDPAGGNVDSGTTPVDPTTASNDLFALPPLNAAFDYQLGGAYTPAAAVEIVSRDLSDPPATGLYNICYVNGFQAQPQEADFWLTQYPELILRDATGEPVIDRRWNELLFDVSSADKRTALAAIISDWIAACRDAGFDAVEIDNLDSYTRSDGLLQEQDAVDFVRQLSDSAHAHDLAIAQKNASSLVPRRAEMGTDFAVAEECNRYQECDDYRAGYGDHVLVIEYSRSDFEAGCTAHPELSIALRDIDLVPAGAADYMFDSC